MIKAVKSSMMIGQSFRLVLALVVLHHSVTTEPIGNIVHREADVTDSRRFVSLGGLFNLRRTSDGRCGALRETSVERVEAMVFAIRTINHNRFLLPGVNLTFDIQDTCFIPNVALERSVEFVQSSDVFCINQTTLAVSGVLGAASSSASTLVASLLRLFNVPQISYGSTAAILSDKSRYDFFFRTIPSDTFQARAMADIIAFFNWTYIYALYSDDTYGRDGINSLIEILESQNGTQRCTAMRITALPVGSNDKQAYDRVVESMTQEWVRNASVAVLFGHPTEATEMMKAIKRVPDIGTRTLLEEIVWIASDSWSSIGPVLSSNRAKGTLGLLPHPGLREDFIEYFVNLNPKNNKTDNPWFNNYWEAIFNCSLDGDTCNISAQNLSTTIRSVTSSYIIDGVYAFANAIHEMIQDYCQNDTICDAIVTRRSTGEAINGTLLRQYLFNVSFESTFSEMPDEKVFDSNGDVQGSYLIVNLQSINGELIFEEVGTWNHVNHLQFAAQIQWPSDKGLPQSVCSLPCEVGSEPHLLPDQGSCCWECKPCLGDNSASTGDQCYECGEKRMPNAEESGCVDIPLTYFTTPSPWAVIILILTCAGIATATIVAVMFAIFHKERVIKASSRELSAFLLGGILLCYILPFLFVVRPSPVLCGVRRFAIGFCFAISYSALLVRSNRIHRIFNQSHASISTPPRFISAVSQVVITCLLISIQVLIAVVWLAAEHPSVEIVQVNSRTLELRCGESPYFGLSVSLCYNLFLLILSTYFAFLTRKVPDNFNEAKFISVTMYSLCIIWLGFLPAYFASTHFGTVYENFFLLLAVLLSASATLLCLLVPKIFIIFFNKEKNDTTSGISAANTTQSTRT